MKKLYYCLYAAVGLLAVALMIPLIYNVMTKFPVVIGINNQSGLSVISVQLAEPGQTFGGNMITSPLSNGRIGKIPHSGHECIRNIRVQYSTGEIQILDNVNGCQNTDTMLSERAGLGSNREANPSFNIINNGTEAIQSVFVSPVNTGRWGIDRLTGGMKINPSQAMPVYLPSGQCNYDAKVVFESGQTAVKKDVDACKISFMAFP